MKVPAVRPVGDLQAPEKRKLHEAASQFEAVFLKQMLASAKIAPSGGHGALALDALADGIARAGGIGLAMIIEELAAKEISKVR
jgi:Rod binding domain-containing protein